MERITNLQLGKLLQLLDSKYRNKEPLVIELLSALLELYCFREMLEKREVISPVFCEQCQYFGKKDGPMNCDNTKGTDYCSLAKRSM